VRAHPRQRPFTLVTVVEGAAALELAGHLRPARVELLARPAQMALAHAQAAELGEGATVHALPAETGYDETLAALRAFLRGRRFDTDAEDVLVHAAGGASAQLALALLTRAGDLPGRLVLAEPGMPVTVVDPVLPDDAAAPREGVALLKGGIATRSAAWETLLTRLESVIRRSPAPILLMGATGAGKSALAKRVHALKRQRGRVTGRFVEVNCATLRGDHALSTLFGHARGAFTGAQTPRDGCLREADGGTLFLDEIGELGLDEQAMLLRAIEDGVYRPLGADRDVHSRFDLVCGTNRDLQAAAEAGTFRDDLRARIDVWTFVLPPLRDRLEDVEPNLDYELKRCARQLGHRVTIRRAARARYLAFGTGAEAAWRGNLRDLSASVMRMATLAPLGEIGEAEVDDEIAELRRLWRRATDAGEGAAASSASSSDPLRTPRADAHLGEGAAHVDLFDRVQLEAVLAACERTPSLSAAGRLLFAVSRGQRTQTNDSQRVRYHLDRFGGRKGSK
jgi:transcriptional regulatory protein RtcR